MKGCAGDGNCNTERGWRMWNFSNYFSSLSSGDNPGGRGMKDDDEEVMQKIAEKYRVAIEKVDAELAAEAASTAVILERLGNIEHQHAELLHLMNILTTEIHDFNESRILGERATVGEYDSRKQRRRRGDSPTQPRR